MARRPGPSLTHADVLAAALDVVARHGPAGLGVNAVAAALGIRPPSLYNHVAGNDALRRAVAIEGWRRLAAVVVDAPDGRPAAREQPADPASARRALVRMADRFRTFVHAHARLYALMSTTVLPPDDPSFRPVLGAVLAPFAAALAPLGLTGPDAIHALRALRAAIHGFVSLEAAGQFGLPYATRESWRRLIATLLDGLAVGTGPRRASRRPRAPR